MRAFCPARCELILLKLGSAVLSEINDDDDDDDDDERLNRRFVCDRNSIKSTRVVLAWRSRETTVCTYHANGDKLRATHRKPEKS